MRTLPDSVDSRQHLGGIHSGNNSGSQVFFGALTRMLESGHAKTLVYAEVYFCC
jgi:hypothetical protein